MDSGQFDAARNEGARSGTAQVDRACLQAGLQRDAGCQTFTCHLGAQIFLKGCLAASTASPGFCDGIPRKEDMAATLQWQVTACAQLGRSDIPCTNFFSRIQEHCHARPERAS